MANCYEQSHSKAREGKFVVWVAIIVPIELLKGFDVVVAIPESHSAMCAAKKAGAVQAEKAEAWGYSEDICSYARIDLGTSFDSGRGSPTMGLPAPDLLVSNNDNCSLLVKWFDVYRRELHIPHFQLDVPFCYIPQREKDLQYILKQFDSLIKCLQELTGQRFDIDRAREAVHCSSEGLKHWKRFLGYAENRPSGNTAFDSFAHMAPYMSCMRGTPEMAEHYKLLADEVEADMAAGLFPVPSEKYRLLWDNIAPWHQLRAMSERLKELDANIVYSTYAQSAGSVEGGVDFYAYEGGDPLRYLARIQNRGVCCYGLNLRIQAMSKMITRFGIDGLIFASNRSCKVYSVMQMDLMQVLSERFHIPSVMIEVDHADVRKYNENNVFLHMEALLERIEAQRKGTVAAVPTAEGGRAVFQKK